MQLGLTFNDVLLVPKRNIVSSRSDVDTTTQLTRNRTLGIPLLGASMDTVTEAGMAIALAREGGLGIIHRFLTVEEEVAEVKKVKDQQLLVGAAIGINGDYFQRVDALVAAGADVLSLDVAHGHADDVIIAVQAIKKKYPSVDLIVGNVATAVGAKDLIDAGADAIKVGVGPGSTCTTRVVTGAGVPQLTAIMDCATVCIPAGIPLIADGGIQTSGDIAKALTAGASSVMCGNVFAGTDEAPGILIEMNRRKFKLFRGMASRSATVDYYKKNGDSMGFEKLIMPEGVQAMVEYKGSVRDIVQKLVAGLRSGISYCGAKDILSMRKNAEFIRITEAGYKESLPHHVEFS
ncbi:MAG: IMP dehydrogenase [archaeon]